MSAIADVARLAGVSKSTASRALSGRGYVSESTRERVVQAAAELGFVVSSNAASLVTGQSRNVGVVIPFINRWFFAEVLDGIESALISSGYDLTLYRMSPDAEQRRRVFDYFLVRKRVDAVIAIGIELTAREVDKLQSLGKPIVGLGGPIDGIPTINIDDVEVTRMATELLINLGHRDILHLGGDLDEQLDFRVHEQRLAGYRLAMASAGLEAHEKVRAVPFDVPGGYAGALQVLADPRLRPTAIVAGCDEVAVGTIIAARQLGIQVPSQLSVVGIDGHSLAPMFGLTTFEQHPAQQGALAVKMILDEPQAPAADAGTRRTILPVTLSVRTSTSGPPTARAAGAA
ncbi:MAG: LacI family DNA-binding transcriptional regulator [Cryobacterium sp.]|nr:LacI family DNA-binding transcriptional regulator [Cryobacterium sp.]MBX3310791.1 LacI family DNA-binding transcriptional regulator [Cryobacterium sp.]MCB1281571.1 LacI family DNA-binding transcriptional regulator [Salinibacterium sp.]